MKRVLDYFLSTSTPVENAGIAGTVGTLALVYNTDTASTMVGYVGSLALLVVSMLYIMELGRRHGDEP